MMTVIPRDNKMHVFHVAQDMLEGFDPHPDVREGGRWVKIIADNDVPNRRLNQIADELRLDGYHVSVVGSKIKVTKDDVYWPNVPEQ